MFFETQWGVLPEPRDPRRWWTEYLSSNARSIRLFDHLPDDDFTYFIGQIEFESTQ